MKFCFDTRRQMYFQIIYKKIIADVSVFVMMSSISKILPVCVTIGDLIRKLLMEALSYELPGVEKLSHA